MTNQEILTKAIQKAIDGGWNIFGDPSMKVARVFEALAPRGWGEYEVYIGPDGNRPYYICTHSALIFNHEFAKALWGEKPWCIDCQENTVCGRNNVCTNCYERSCGLRWQYHLQQMVIADDPIKYLGEHLDG